MDLSELEEQYEAIPHGPERANAIRAAIAQADAAGEHRWKLYYRDELVSELAHYGDPIKRLPVCAEYVDLFEKQPIDRYKCIYLWVMSSALRCWDQLPQLTLDERRKMLTHYLQGVHRYGGSLREYHSQEFWQCLYEGKTALARTHQKQYMQAKPPADGDEVADSSCLACWHFHCGENYLALGDWNRGIKRLQPIISGRIRCKQEPIRTYSTLVAHALALGRREDADHFAKRLAPRINWSAEGLPFEHLMMIRYWALTNPKRGLHRLEKMLPAVFQCWSKNIQQGYYYNAWMVCAALARRADWLTGDLAAPLVGANLLTSSNSPGLPRPDASPDHSTVETVSLALPQTFPLYRADGRYRLDELAQWFRDEMLTIARAFDTRNGYPWEQQSIDKERYIMAQMLQEEWAKPVSPVSDTYPNKCKPHKQPQ